MLSTIVSSKFETPLYELGDEVIYHYRSLLGREIIEPGVILGYWWSPTGKLEAYHFAPHSERSTSYPCQPVEPNLIETLPKV